MPWTALWAGTADEYTVQHARDLTRQPLTDDHMTAAEAELRAQLGFDVRAADTVHPLAQPVYTHERAGVGRALAWLACHVLQQDAHPDDGQPGGPLVESATTGDQSVKFAQPTPLQAAQGNGAPVDYQARAHRELARAGVLGRVNNGRTHHGGAPTPRWAHSPIVNDI